jgi:hypothetical protein
MQDQKKYMMALPVTLNREEMKGMNEELLRLLDEQDQIENARKAAMDDFKAQLSAVDKRTKEVRNSLVAGTKLREVEVMEVANPSEMVIEIHRLDRPKHSEERIVKRRSMDLFEANDPEIQTSRDEEAALADAAAEVAGKKKRGRPPTLVKAAKATKKRGNGKADSDDDDVPLVTSEMADDYALTDL